MTVRESAPIDPGATEPHPSEPTGATPRLIEFNGMPLLELDGAYFRLMPLEGSESTSALEDTCVHVPVVPVDAIKKFLETKDQDLTADAKRVVANRTTLFSTPQDRISYANEVSLVAGQKLILREISEILPDVSVPGQLADTDSTKNVIQ